MRDCNYRLPCGRCEKYDIDCDVSRCEKCVHDWKLDKQIDISCTDIIQCISKCVCIKCGKEGYQLNMRYTNPRKKDEDCIWMFDITDKIKDLTMR